jgi:hypothetical protein
MSGLTRGIVLALVAGQVASQRVGVVVHECGIGFEPANDYPHEARVAGRGSSAVNNKKAPT